MHCSFVYYYVLNWSFYQKQVSKQAPLFVLLLMLTVVVLRDETAALQTQLLHLMLAMTLAGHCPIPEKIQTTVKSQSVCLSVCLYCYMYRILYIWLVIINKYTEDSFHIIINSGLITSCLMKLYAIEKRKNTMRRCPHSSIFTSNPCICDGTEEVGQLRSLTS